MRRSKLPNRNTILFNGAAILIGGASVLFALKSSLIAEDVEQCSARYAQGTRMALERGGAPLTPEDLQARLAGTDWGVLDRAKVVKVKSGPAPVALQVDLTGAKADDRDESNGREGMGFTWGPRSMGQVTAACLAYSVYVPDGFDFGGGGRLPGLMGMRGAGEEANPGNGNGITVINGTATSNDPDAPAFSARYAWRENGSGDIHTQIPSLAEGRSLGNDRSGFTFPRGRWVALEQEVVLNEGKLKNGVMRVWLDGSLRFEKTNVVFRESDTAKITGVLAEVVPMGRDTKADAKDQKLLLSPFEVRWK